jgi:hypothetical protein
MFYCKMIIFNVNFIKSPCQNTHKRSNRISVTEIIYIYHRVKTSKIQASISRQLDVGENRVTRRSEQYGAPLLLQFGLSDTSKINVICCNYVKLRCVQNFKTIHFLFYFYRLKLVWHIILIKFAPQINLYNFVFSKSICDINVLLESCIFNLSSPVFLYTYNSLFNCNN